MRDNFRSLLLCQSAIHRSLEVVNDLRGLAACNERADRH